MRPGILMIVGLTGLVLVGCPSQGGLPKQMPATKQGIGASVSPATDRCKVCGAPLFHAIPHVTTREEIIAFAKSSKAFRNDKDALNGWLHPGIYCPNGCTEIWIEFPEPIEKSSSSK